MFGSNDGPLVSDQYRVGDDNGIFTRKAERCRATPSQCIDDQRPSRLVGVPQVDRSRRRTVGESLAGTSPSAVILEVSKLVRSLA